MRPEEVDRPAAAVFAFFDEPGRRLYSPGGADITKNEEKTKQQRPSTTLGVFSLSSRMHHRSVG